MPDAMNYDKPAIETRRGLHVDLATHPHGPGTQAYESNKGIIDTLGLLDPHHYDINPQLAHWLHSPVVGRIMRMRGKLLQSRGHETAEETTQQLFNDQFVTYNEGGRGEVEDSLNLINPVALIRRCFAEGKEDHWPTLLLTTNHALTSDHTHIAGIMRGLRKMVEDAHGRKLDYVAHPDEHADLKGKTLILSSVYTQPTPQENGADLLDRLQELSGRRPPGSDGSSTGRLSNLPGHWLDWMKSAAVDSSALFNPRRFMSSFLPSTLPEREHASPAARRLSKLLLALMVTEPERIHFGAPCTEAKLMTGDAEGRRPSLPDYMQIGEVPLTLRTDASRVVSRVLLAGYSKGGNMVSDAVRLLKDELDGALRHKMLDHEAFRKESGLSPQQLIPRLLSGIGLMSIAAGEEPLTLEEKNAGIRRVNILSDKDLIASHFAAGREHEYHSRDELIHVKGTNADMGHRWQHALMEAPGLTTGYIIADEKARQHVQAISSQLFDGLPAIWDFRFERSGERGREYRLSFRPGVLRRNIESWGEMLGNHLKENLRHGENILPLPFSAVQVSVTQDAPTAIVLTVPDSQNRQPGFASKLQQALQEFCRKQSILLPPYVVQDIGEQIVRDTPPGQGFAEKIRAGTATGRAIQP